MESILVLTTQIGFVHAADIRPACVSIRLHGAQGTQTRASGCRKVFPECEIAVAPLDASDPVLEFPIDSKIESPSQRIAKDVGCQAAIESTQATFRDRNIPRDLI